LLGLESALKQKHNKQKTKNKIFKEEKRSDGRQKMQLLNKKKKES
jgi:hypothetical protein